MQCPIQVFLSVLCLFSLVVKLCLPDGLTTRWRGENSRRFFINVYAINTSNNLSTAFTPLMPLSLPLCHHRRPVTHVWIKLRPMTYVLHWLNYIAFNWPQNASNIAMFLQPCRRPRHLKALYTLQIFIQ